MQTMVIHHSGYVFRWRGGSFIAVWEAERAHEIVPDRMLDVPASLNRSKATRADIVRIVGDHLTAVR